MATKFAAAVAVAVALCAAPAVSFAGGEVQYQAQASYQQQAYGPPQGAYARPGGAYYGSYCSPCASQPCGYGSGYGYGYGYQSGGGLFGNPVFTAGLLGLGLGYAIWH